MIRAQQRERHPALRAAVPAPREIPDNPETRQVRIIPPPRPRPRAAFRPRAVPAVPARITAGAITARRLRPRLLRRPAEHHPLQYRQAGPQFLQLSRLRRVLLTQPRVLLARPRVIPAQLLRRLRELPVRLQRRCQRIPQGRLSTLRNRDNADRNRHAAQQTPSAVANHAPRASVSHEPSPGHPSRDFRILTSGRRVRHPALPLRLRHGYCRRQFTVASGPRP